MVKRYAINPIYMDELQEDESSFLGQSIYCHYSDFVALQQNLTEAEEEKEAAIKGQKIWQEACQMAEERERVLQKVLSESEKVLRDLLNCRGWDDEAGYYTYWVGETTFVLAKDALKEIQALSTKHDDEG